MKVFLSFWFLLNLIHFLLPIMVRYVRYFFLRLKLNASYPVFIYSRTLRLSKERTPFLLRSFEISPHPLKHPSIPPPCIQIPASAFPHYFFLLLFLSFFFTKIRRSSVFCEILSSKMPGQRKLRITVNETIQGLRDQNGHSLPLSESRKAHPPSSLFHRPIRASTSL